MLLVLHTPGLEPGYLRGPLEALDDEARFVDYERDAEPAEWLEQIHAASGDEPVTLFGHGLGGLLAQAYARAHPERVSRLILCSTAPSLDWMSERLRDLRRMVEHLSDEEFGEMCLEVLPFAVCDPARPARRELAERLGRMRFDPHAFARVLTLTQPEGKLELPTLIVHGKYDRVIWPTIGGQGLLHEIPNAELILFWKSGHFPFLEQPGPFVMVVEEFLRGRPSQPSALLA